MISSVSKEIGVVVNTARTGRTFKVTFDYTTAAGIATHCPDMVRISWGGPTYTHVSLPLLPAIQSFLRIRSKHFSPYPQKGDLTLSDVSIYDPPTAPDQANPAELELRDIAEAIVYCTGYLYTTVNTDDGAVDVTGLDKVRSGDNQTAINDSLSWLAEDAIIGVGVPAMYVFTQTLKNMGLPAGKHAQFSEFEHLLVSTTSEQALLFRNRGHVYFAISDLTRNMVYCLADRARALNLMKMWHGGGFGASMFGKPVPFSPLLEHRLSKLFDVDISDEGWED